MTPNDHVAFDWADGCVAIRLIGEIDQDVVKSIRRLVHEMVDLATVGPVTVDLSAVTFLDSAGLGLIVGLFKRTHAQLGVLTVLGANDAVRRGFAVTGLDKVLSVG